MRNIRTFVVCATFAAFLTVAQAGDYPSITLESLLTPEQQTALNIAGMSAQRREVLRSALIAAYTAGFQRGKSDAQRPVNHASMSTAPATGGVIETQIDGDFEGWSGETIVKLENGQIWQQTEYYYEYSYAFMPKVFLYQSGGGWKMKVEGVEEAVGVQRLR